ncbi:MAG: alkaline phosphatase [Vicinamibacterales bacterium]
MTTASRRRFLQTALAGGAGLAVPRGVAVAQAPAIVTSDRMRPQTPSGLQIGDVVSDRAIVWSRSDRPARLIVERASTEAFRDAVEIRGPVAHEINDFVTTLDLTGLPADRPVFIRVTFEDLATGRTRSAPLEGRFRTAPRMARPIRFVWSGDTAGQGYGINPAWGGMKTYEAMRLVRPDFFIHSGDTIYADNPILPEVALPDGTMWRNLVTEETSKVAETLAEFRGRFKYNLLDDNVRRFSAEVPQLWQWDDHEVVNNWSSGKDLATDARYVQKSIDVLVAHGLRSFLDYAPMRRFGQEDAERVYRRIPYGPQLDVLMLDARSYRAANSHNRQERPSADTAYLGRQQLEWLKQALEQSSALWKVVAHDMPIGLVVSDGQGPDGRDRFEAVANGDGPPLGRELELVELLRFIKQRHIRNVVWITADVHYTAAHYYDPARAQFTEFEPFWEFVSGPLNAGSFGPNALDNTFGPRVVFQKYPPTPNAAPSAGYQFFGQVDIEPRSGEMVVTLKDGSGASLFSRTLTPAR